MLDAIAQMVAEQAVKSVPPAPVVTQAAQAPQQTTVPVLKAPISPPESIAPVARSPAVPSAPPPAAKSTNHPATEASTASTAPLPTAQASTGEMKPATPIEPAVAVDRRQQATSATDEQRLWLKQRLADIVAKEKPLKDAKRRATLEAMAIALAQAGQFAQARQMAQDVMLAPETQATLLAQIDAIAAKRSLTKSTVAIKPPLLKPLLASGSAGAPPKSGRSLPAVPSTLSSMPPQYSYVPQTEPQYVSYALKGFGRTIGGIGIVVDDSTPAFNGQWTATDDAANRFNAALWNGLSFIFPLAMPVPITSGFGWRVHPIGGDRRFHSGTDLGAAMGTPVLAAADGKVALADELNGYGLAIILSHQDDTRETLYGHLSAIFVKPGQWVAKGTVIGRVGSTGLSTGPHLHFELRQKTADGWQPIDPGAQLQYALARLIKALQSG